MIVNASDEAIGIAGRLKLSKLTVLWDNNSITIDGDVSLSDGFVEGDTLECWAHGSAFSLRTGRPLNLPAYEPVPVYEVTIDGDDILIDPAVTKDVN